MPVTTTSLERPMDGRMHLNFELRRRRRRNFGSYMTGSGGRTRRSARRRIRHPVDTGRRRMTRTVVLVPATITISL